MKPYIVRVNGGGWMFVYANNPSDAVYKLSGKWFNPSDVHSLEVLACSDTTREE